MGARMKPMQVNPAAAHMYIVNPLASFKGGSRDGKAVQHPPAD